MALNVFLYFGKILVTVVTTQGKKHDLRLQNLQTTVGKKITKFKASQLWNQLPNEIKDIKSESLFKSRIKIYLYNKLYTK